MTPQTVDAPACTLCSRRARRAPDAIRDRTKKILVKRHPLSSIKWMRTRCASGGQVGCLKIFWSRQWGFERENKGNTWLFIFWGSLLKGAPTGNHGFTMPSEGFRKTFSQVKFKVWGCSCFLILEVSKDFAIWPIFGGAITTTFHWWLW